jgi:transposase-like protein
MESIATELVALADKRDVSGRRLTGSARRVAVLRAYDESGMTVRAFAQKEGVNYHTLTTWLGRRRERQAARTEAPVRFTELRPARVRPTGLEVALPNGIVIRGQDAQQVAILIKALGR